MGCQTDFCIKWWKSALLNHILCTLYMCFYESTIFYCCIYILHGMAKCKGKHISFIPGYSHSLLYCKSNNPSILLSRNLYILFPIMYFSFVYVFIYFFSISLSLSYSPFCFSIEFTVNSNSRRYYVFYFSFFFYRCVGVITRMKFQNKKKYTSHECVLIVLHLLHNNFRIFAHLMVTIRWIGIRTSHNVFIHGIIEFIFCFSLSHIDDTYWSSWM